MPETTRDLIELFTLGKRVEASRARRAFGAELLSDLVSVGLLQEIDHEIETDHYALIACSGGYFLATRHSKEAPRRVLNVYLGAESYTLMHALGRARPAGRVLDLCSGTGILGQASARWADHVIAVEHDAEAATLSRANAALNGVESSWEVRQGDLWDPVRGERFDLVVSNPPFLPIPTSFGFPKFGDGGPDGLGFVRRILEGIPDALSPNGRAQLVFECGGTAREPAVIPLLKELSRAHPTWSIELLLDRRLLVTRNSLAPLAESIALTEQRESDQLPEVLRAIHEHFRRNEWAYFFGALLFVDSAPEGRRGLDVLALYPSDGRPDAPDDGLVQDLLDAMEVLHDSTH